MTSDYLLIRVAMVGLIGLVASAQVTAETQGFFYPDVAAENQKKVAGKLPAQGPSKVVLVPLKSTNIPVIGSGFNLLTGLPTISNCLTKFTSNPSDLNDIKSSLSQTIDSEATYYKLNQTVSAKGKYGGFGGEGSYSSTTETKTTYNGTTLVVWAAIERNVEKIALPANADDTNRVLDLAPSFRRLSALNGGWEFRESCGDGYVDAIVKGTELYSVFNLKDFKYESKKTVEKTIEGSYGGDVFSASGSSKLQTELTTSKNDLNIVGWTRGSSQAELATNLEELKTLYRNLPSLDAKAARALYATVVIYSELPSASKSIPTPYVAFEGQTQTLIRMHFLREVLSQALTEVGSPESATTFLFFPGKGPQAQWGVLTGLTDMVDSKIETVTRRVERCYADAKTCEYSDEDRLNDLIYEYLIRAQMPLARSGVRANEAATITRQMSSGSAVQIKYARSSYADHLYADNILRPSNLRCRDRGECIPASLLNAAAGKICESLESQRVHATAGIPLSIICDLGEKAQAAAQQGVVAKAHIEARTIIIPTPPGVVPAVILKSHSGIGQQTRIQYFEGDELIHGEDVFTPRNDSKLRPPLYLQRSLSNDNRLEIVSWGIGKDIAGRDRGGPSPERLRARIRESTVWGQEYVYAYETEDFWNNNTWDDTRIGYDQNFAVLAPAKTPWRSVVGKNAKVAFVTDKNGADVSVAVDNILERGPPSAKVQFEFATSECGKRQVKGTYEYTAVTEDAQGRVSEKTWSRAFDGQGPVFTEFDYPSVAGDEELTDIIDEKVVTSSCP